MATVPSETNISQPIPASRFEQFNQLSNQKKLGLILSAAAIVALLAGAFMWSQTPEYRVLYNNVSDQDGSSIISALQHAPFSACPPAPVVHHEQVDRHVCVC